MKGFFFVMHPITDHEIILTSPSSFLMGSFSFIHSELHKDWDFARNKKLTLEVR